MNTPVGTDCPEGRPAQQAQRELSLKKKVWTIKVKKMRSLGANKTRAVEYPRLVGVSFGNIRSRCNTMRSLDGDKTRIIVKKYPRLIESLLKLIIILCTQVLGTNKLLGISGGVYVFASPTRDKGRRMKPSRARFTPSAY